MAKKNPQKTTTRRLKARTSENWNHKLQSWLRGASAYRRANTQKLREVLGEGTVGVHMVVNIGAWSLLRMISDGRYKNAYDLRHDEVLPEIGSEGSDPEHKLRVEVDKLMGFADPSRIYFGAAALESAGVRFYGEYCMVLKFVDPKTQIIDRDSFELVLPPLASSPNRRALARALKGSWSSDLFPMAAFKVREVLDDPDRLTTEGRMRDALLRGEEYIEVHREGTFSTSDLVEVRQAATDIAADERIASAFDRGVVPSIEEIIWRCQRAEVERKLAMKGIETRVTDAAFVR